MMRKVSNPPIRIFDESEHVRNGVGDRFHAKTRHSVWLIIKPHGGGSKILDLSPDFTMRLVLWF
jgi:hypothetical protein